MKELVETLVKHLVDQPEQVEITQVEGERVIVFEVRVAQSDLGKVIGRGGGGLPMPCAPSSKRRRPSRAKRSIWKSWTRIEWEMAGNGGEQQGAARDDGELTFPAMSCCSLPL